MDKKNDWSETYSQWRYVSNKYGKDPSNFPLRVILQNCKQKIGVEINSISLHRDHDQSPFVKLITNHGEMIITPQNTWQLTNGQTRQKKTIFTHDLEY